jgi:threonine/homoserine/homoserine lactone efflux protein
MLLGVILSFIAVIWFGIVGYFAGLIGTFIQKNQTIQAFIKYLSGSVLVLLGLRLAIKKE